MTTLTEQAADAAIIAAASTLALPTVRTQADTFSGISHAVQVY